MTPDTIIKAIRKINSNAQFTLSGTDLDSIVWQSGTSPISKSDIETKINEVENEHNAEEWKRNRQAEYPSAVECVHALLDGGDTLTNLQSKRTAVKEKYPKS